MTPTSETAVPVGRSTEDPDNQNATRQGLLVPTPIPEQIGSVTSPYDEFASNSLDHMILLSDTIVLVQPLDSVTASGKTIQSDDGVAPTYRPMLEFRFKVVRYLKGNGEAEIEVEAPARRTYVSLEKAGSHIDSLEKGHDNKWDDHEAILFLVSPRTDLREFGAIEDGTTYHFTSSEAFLDHPYDNQYSIDSHNKAWIPAIEPGGSSEAGADSQKFWVDPKPIKGVTELIEISVAELESRIGAVDLLLAEGRDIDGYEVCLRYSFGLDAWMRRYLEVEGKPYVPGTREDRIASGLPAGTVIDDGSIFGEGYIKEWVMGPVAELFEVVHADTEGNLLDIDFEATRTEPTAYRLQFRTARPLPADVYELDVRSQHADLMPCNYVPDHPPGKNITTVYGPEGTLHEALFDPVDGDGDTVGISADNGNLKSDAFTVDGSEIQVDRIDWSAGNVEMQITPHNALADHNIDFIALDGSVSLRLDFEMP